MYNKIKFILSAFFLAEFGRAMYFVVITWLLYKMTDDPFFTGLLVSLGFIPGLLLNLLFGVIVDRMNRKFLSITATLINTLAISTVVVSLLIGVLNPWTIIIVHMILQLMGSLFRPSIQAFIAEIFQKEELPKIYSQSSSSAILGSLIGASLGGIILGFTSAITALTTVTICFLLAAISLSLLKYRYDNSTNKESKNTIVKDLVGGIHYLKNNKFLFNLFGVMLVGQLTFHTSIGFLSVYTKEHLNQSVTVYGFLDTTLSIGGVLAGILGTWWWNKNSNYLSTRSLLIVFIGLLLVGFTPLLPIAFLGVFLIGMGTTWIRILLQSVQQILTDKEYHGRMASYRMICNQGSVVISGPILGWIASENGANWVFLALLIPTALAIVFSLKQAKNPTFKEITQKSA